jgi:hypothetical protein
LIRAQRPWPQPGTSLVRIEHYYYDGVRRIQEVFVDPLEDANINTKGVNSKDEGDAPVQVLASLIWTAREYIWGPDYVDELVAQIALGERRPAQFPGHSSRPETWGSWTLNSDRAGRSSPAADHADVS